MIEGHTAEQLRELLERGADVTNSITDRIAIHVLHRAGLLGKRFLGNYISIETVAMDGDQVRLAFIRDLDDRSDRSEQLFACDRHPVRHAREDVRRKHETSRIASDRLLRAFTILA